MGDVHGFRSIIRSVLLTSGAIFGSSVLFYSVGGFLEYREYLSTYQKNQQADFQSIQKKISIFTDNIVNLSDIIVGRIQKDPNHHRKTKSALELIPALRDMLVLPRFQAVRYFKLSSPQAVMTSFGIIAQEKISPQTQPAVAIKKDVSLIFGKEALTAQTPVFSKGKQKEGLLEIQIAPSEFKTFIGVPSFFISDHQDLPEDALLSNTPFPLYKKAPLGFFALMKRNQNHFISFGFLVFLCVTLLFLNILRLTHLFNKRYRIKIKSLKSIADQNAQSSTLSNISLETLKSAFSSYCKLHANIMNRHQDQEQALEALVQGSLDKNLLTQSEAGRELVTIARSCLKANYRFVNGWITNSKKEDVFPLRLLESAKELLGERIQKFQIELIISCPEDFFFQGDSVFVEMCFVNVLGRALNRIPRYGKVFILLEQKGGKMCLEIQDEGYTIDQEFSEKSFSSSQRSFALFLKDEVFSQMCSENEVHYSVVETEENLNVTRLVIPDESRQEYSGNVISLFQ